MKRRCGFYVSLSILLLNFLASASEQRVRMRDLPPEVRAAALEQSKGAELKSVSKEIENGKTRYEIKTIVNGHSKDIEFDSSGNVLEVEEEVMLSSIPDGARVAIQSAATGGKILRVETVTLLNSAIAYEADINRAGKRSEIRVDSKGKLVPEQD